MAPAPMIAIFIVQSLLDISCDGPSMCSIPSYRSRPSRHMHLPRSSFHRRKQLPAAEARLRGHLSAWRDFHCAILEFRYLPDRIQRRVGQHVGGGLVITERDEDRTLRRAFVSARVQRDAAAARLDREHVTWFHTQSCQVERIERRYGVRLDGIE